MQDVINSIDEKGNIYINLPENFRNRTWSETFGESINLIKNSYDEIDIVFDMKECVWIDPLPILSILVTTSQFAKKNCNLELILPGQIIDDNITVPSNQQKIIAFLYSEGFIQSFYDKNFIIKIDSENIFIEKIEELALRFSSKIIFKNSSIIPAKIVDLGNSDEHSIISIVNTLLQDSAHVIESIVSKQNSTEVHKNIKLFLNETLLNVLNHAYPDDVKSKNCGVYLRFRKGLLNLKLTEYESSKLKNAFLGEKNFCPRLNTDFGESTSGFFEVFVLDHGIGMSKSFLGDIEYSENRYPFRIAWSYSIDRGDRNKSLKRNTNYGGLYILHREISRGYVNAFDENEWTGEFLPLKSRITDTEKSEYKKFKIPGFSIVGRISWKIDFEIFKDWYSPDLTDFEDHYYIKSLNEEIDIYDKYYGKRLSDFNIPLFYIRDDRFPNTPKYYPKGYLRNLKFSHPVCFYFPQDDLSKFEIHSIISRDFASVMQMGKTLVIGDIDISQSNIFQYAINKAHFNKDKNNGFDKIILITRHLSVLILEKKIDPDLWYYTYKINTQLAKNYFSISRNFDPDKSIYSYLEFIKTHDSLIFWKNIFSKKDKESFFITGSIKWYNNNDSINVGSYFNFAETLSDSISRKIYQIVITRAFCLRNKSGVQFFPTDVLTEKIAFETNVNSYYFYSRNGMNVYLGSVFVTGSTKNNFVNHSAKSIIQINFFKNLSCVGMNKTIEPHFFIWPNKNFIKQTSNSSSLDYRRIGSLPAIAPYGWKYFAIPRYIHSDPKYKHLSIFDLFSDNSPQQQNIIEDSFVSSTSASPPDTYNDWQTDKIVNIGHFENNTYHDIYKIDVPFAFKESWKYHTDLACFVISEIMVAFGIKINTLILDSKVFKNKLQLYQTKNNIVIPGEPQVDIMVYSFHHSTDTIVLLLKSILTDNIKEKIIPLISINRSKNNFPNFFSSQVIDKIKNIKPALSRPKKALIFDTFRISGKTTEEIKNLLSTCGYTDNIVLNIVNRDLIPLHPNINSNYKTFWRFDIPILGKKQSCLLCKGLERMKLIRNYLTDDRIIERLDEWLTAWEAQYRYASDNLNHGIGDEIINFSQDIQNGKKNFGVYVDPINKKTKQIGGENNKLTLKSSYGLTIYTNEIFAMTTRDNLALELSALDYLSMENKLQLLSINLLLFNSQFSNNTKLEYYSKIIDLIKDSLRINNHTSFALLILCSQDDIDEDFILGKIIEPGNSSLKTFNIDMLLFLCEYSRRTRANKISKINEINRLFSFVDNEFDLYRQFHYELVNDNGTYHDRPIHLITLLKIPTKPMYQMGYSSLKKLEFLIEKFYESEFTNFDNLLDNEKEKKEIHDCITNLKSKIDTLIKLDDKNFDSQTTKDDIGVKADFKNVYNKFLKFHQSLFIKFNILKPYEEFPIKQYFYSFLNKNEFSEIGISNAFAKPKDLNYTTTEKWTLWNTTIIWLIKDVLSNVRHVKTQKAGMMLDPFDDGEIMKSMWVYTEYKDNYIFINFLNLTKMSISDIVNFSKNKLMLTKINICRLNGDLYHEDVSDEIEVKNLDQNCSVLKTVIKLPIL